METKQRNKDVTRQMLIDAVEDIVEDEGFEALGVRRVAERAGVNKTLIYRYFGSIDGLIYACLAKHDFWLSLPENLPAELFDTQPGEHTAADIKAYLKEFYRRQIAHQRSNTIMKRLRRWELSADNELIRQLRARREENGVRFTRAMIALTHALPERTHAIAALIDAGIGYMSMLGDSCAHYNGIDIASDHGWEQLAAGIDSLIDIMTE